MVNVINHMVNVLNPKENLISHDIETKCEKHAPLCLQYTLKYCKKRSYSNTFESTSSQKCSPLLHILARHEPKRFSKLFILHFDAQVIWDKSAHQNISTKISHYCTTIVLTSILGIPGIIPHF